ncbi:MAG: 3',5'-cyclic-AMP phosphodiesterase [Kangiellaceae bacterium]|nr:3',5'-cyclic-AMP phosphodiesterase [Kangiellaceae bacterium]
MENTDRESLPFELLPSRTDVVRLVQVSDSHIFADPKGRLLGLNTRESFEAVCKRVVKEEWRADALLATGDLAQDSSAEAYEYLASYFDSMDVPTFWIAGNHDNPKTMDKYLNSGQTSLAKHIIIGNWQIILLDSSVAGKVYGELAESQLKFLEQTLTQNQDKHSLVVLHHQPVEVGSKWLDAIGLNNSDQFTALISQYSQVKGVLWGHVHQEFHKTIDGVHWIASPSSCVQFKPGSEDFCADTNAPGYRYLNLHSDGRIESVVHRIDNIEFTVDYTIKGY